MKHTCSVIKGQGRGKGVGYPTFNLTIPPKFSLKPGIYACWVWLDNVKYKGALHFGPIPVFNQPTNSLEIFVLDYSSKYLINRLTFTPVKFLRPIQNFPSPQALASQISRDVSRVRKFLSTKN